MKFLKKKDMDSMPASAKKKIISKLYSEILKQKGLLFIKKEAIEARIEKDNAVILVDERRMPAGFISFADRLGPILKKKIMLHENVPQIFEIATGYVSEKHRGKGYFKKLMYEILKEKKEEIKKNKILFVAIAKQAAVVKTFADVVPMLKENLGLEIRFSCFKMSDFQMIRPFLVVYDKNNYEGEKHKLVDRTVRKEISTEKADAIDEVLDGKLDMTDVLGVGVDEYFMLVSSWELASKTDAELRKRFEYPERLTVLLIRKGYSI